MSVLAVVLLIVAWFAVGIGVALLFGHLVQAGSGKTVASPRAVIYTRLRERVRAKGRAVVQGEHLQV